MTTHAAQPLSLTRAHAAALSPPAAARAGALTPAPHLARPVTITWRSLLDPARPPSSAPAVPHVLQLDITLTTDSRAAIRITLLDRDAHPLPSAAPLPTHLHDALTPHAAPAALALTHDPTLNLVHAHAPGLIAATFQVSRPLTPGAPPTLDLLFARTPLLRATGLPSHAFDGPFVS